MSEGAVILQPKVVDLPVTQIPRASVIAEVVAVPPTSSYRQDLQGKKVWIDIDNSPHVPFFLPIIKELENRGAEVVLTA